MSVSFEYSDKGVQLRKTRSAVFFSFVMLCASLSALEFGIWKAMATTDQDGDGLSYGLEFLINTQPQDWDTDNDGLPDGWEWQYGLDPLSSLGNNGSTGDPDLDSLNNLNEYLISPSYYSNPRQIKMGLSVSFK